MRLSTAAMVSALFLGGGLAVAPVQAQMPPGFDPAAIRQMIMDNFKEQLGATDQEWNVIGPKVMKVLELRVESGAFAGMMGGGGGRGGRGGAGGMARLMQQFFGSD